MRAFIVFSFFLFYTLLAGAELTITPGDSSPSTSKRGHGNCSGEESAKNIEILQYCNDNWDRWGVTEKPPKEELISPTSCPSTSSSALNGCADALMAFPVLLGEMTIVGLVKLAPEDKQSLAYIAQNGSLQDMQAHYSAEFLRTKANCGLGSAEEDQRHMNKNCTQNLADNSADRKEACNKALDTVRAAVTCRRSPETRALYKQHKDEIVADAQKLYNQKLDRENTKKEKKASLENLKNKCGPIMNPYSESYTKMFLNPLRYIGQATANFVKPDPSAVAKYNKCIADNSKDDPEFQDKLKKSGGSLVDSMTGNIESLKCYRKDLQIKFKCEIAAAVISGGAGGAVLAAKKLGRKAVDAQLKRSARKGTAEVASAAVDTPKKFPLAPAGTPRTDALAEYTARTGREVETRVVPGAGEVIVDKETGQAIFRFKYKWDGRDGTPKFKDITAEVVQNESRDGFKQEYKGHGFYSYFFNKMVRNNPEVKRIESDLWYDNAEMFRRNMDAGYSPVEAFKGTAAYRVYLQNGFTEIQEDTIRIRRDATGKITGVTATVLKP